VYVVLPGNPDGKPTAFAGLVNLSPVVYSFSASMSMEGAVSNARDDEALPAWPNAFALQGFDIYNLAFSAGILPVGLPGEVGFSASMSLRSDGMKYLLGISGMVSADPGRLMVRLEAVNLDQCFFIVLAKVLIGQGRAGRAGAFGPLDDVRTLCLAFSWWRLDYLLLYFSTGAQIGGIEYPPGGVLEGRVTLFKSIQGRVNGVVDMGSFTASLTGKVDGFSLGPIKVSGFDSEDLEVGATDAHTRAAASTGARGRSLDLTAGLYLCVCCVRVRVTDHRHSVEEAHEVAHLTGRQSGHQTRRIRGSRDRLSAVAATRRSKIGHCGGLGDSRRSQQFADSAFLLLRLDVGDAAHSRV